MCVWGGHKHIMPYQHHNHICQEKSKQFYLEQSLLKTSFLEEGLKFKADVIKFLN